MIIQFVNKTEISRLIEGDKRSMQSTDSLTALEKLKYNAVSSWIYRTYFIRRALRTGEPELRGLSLLTTPGRLALDIGSNKGAYSYLLASMGLETHAFEPQPSFYERLRRTAPRNLTCHNIALSDSEAEMDFYLPMKNGRVLNQIATLRDISGQGDSKVIRVKACTLDSLKLNNVGFIKIDAEGWEQQVLDGARETILRDRPTLLVEIEEKHTGQDLWSSLRFVEELGYTTHCYHEDKVQPLAAFFDIERHHRSFGEDRYYNNFIFLPT